MRTTRLLVLGTALLAILVGCGGDEPTGPTDPDPTPDPDVTAPSVSMAFPAPEQELQGAIELRAGATDNVGVTRVQFLVDGEPYGAEVKSPPYRTRFDSRTVADGAHTVAARAWDAAGLSTVSEPVSVMVYNVPGIVELTVEAPAGLNDADGFELLVDGVRLRDLEGTGTYTVTDVPPGTRRLTLRGLPPFCGADEQTVKVRSDAPASAVVTIGCLASAADGWVLMSRRIGNSLRLSALSLRTGKETVLVPELDGLAAVSPDGNRLAFIDDGTLMIGDLAAFAPTAVASVPLAWEVSWSPDGSALVVASGGEYVTDLFIVNADGTNLHPVFDTPGFRRRPAWSATGRIAFESVSGGPMGDVTSIWAVDTDGGNLVQLTPGTFDEFPAWSHDGSRLAYTRWYFTSSTTDVQVAIVNADGTGAAPIVGDDALAHPVWSPDAMWIVHASPHGLQATHVSGTPTMPVTSFPAQPLAWVAGDRFD